MKGRVILIDMPKERASQAALLVDGRLEDLLLDPPKGDTTPQPGEIYWAKVDRLVPKMGGAFVRLTPTEQGFLRETKGLKEGQGVLVQVTSYSEPGKATPVTARILYKGRRVIHTPDAPGINVSRQIKDPEERRRLSGILERFVAAELEDANSAPMGLEEGKETIDMAAEAGVSEVDARTQIEHWEQQASWLKKVYGDGGFIIRSASEGSPEDELIEETRRVVAMDWAAAAPPSKNSDTGLSRMSGWALDRLIREWCHPVPTHIFATHQPFRILSLRSKESGAEQVSAYRDFCCRALMSALSEFDGDPFDHYGVWDEIEKLKLPRVDLPSGAWMAIETTRAMVTVDVNTGGRFDAGAAMTANVEAARELPRQLRLRGLGGQITIDFAPMKKMHRKKIEETLKAAFAKDPIATTLAGWTPLGNFELQRKRERRPLSELL